MPYQDEQSVQEEVDRLLSGRTRDIRLSSELQARFRERSFKQTSKIIRAWMIWVIVLDVLAMIVNLLLLPREPAVAMLGPALLMPPAALAVYLAWARKLPFAALDAVLTLGMLAILLSVALMSYVAGDELQERYLSVMLFVAVTAIIIFNVPQSVTYAISGAGLALYLVFQLAHPALGTASAFAAFLFFASGVTATVVARQTMTILAHRTFLLELRDARRVAELASANAKLEQLSRTDPLTGLSNRRHSDDVLAMLFDRDRPSTSSLALLMCDIDCFKALNDRLGHLEGDKALAAVARTITRSVRPKDHVARFGGEEFLVVLVDVNAQEAQSIAQDIRLGVEALKLANPGSSAGPVLTISIGVAAEVDHPGCTASELHRAADAALYHAKSQGRNRVALASGGTAQRRHAS